MLNFHPVIHTSDRLPNRVSEIAILLEIDDSTHHYLSCSYKSICATVYLLPIAGSVFTTSTTSQLHDSSTVIKL